MLAPACAQAADIVGFGAEYPEVRFALPATTACRDVTPAGFLATPERARLLEIKLPVSMVVTRGEVQRVEELAIEVRLDDAALVVHQFSPATRLETEFASEIQVKTTTGGDRQFDASLGGVLPISGGVAHLTPSITAGSAEHQSATETATRKPPKQAVVVSGALNHRRGAFFKFRRSSQTTLEGEHELSLTFAVPAQWERGQLTVACQARGERKVLFVKQRKIWGSTTAPVNLHLAGATPTREPERPTPVLQTVAKPTAVESIWKLRNSAEVE